MKATNIYKLTSTLSLDRRGFDQSGFIMLFMVFSGWHSLFTEHHVGPVGTHIPSIVIKYGKKIVLYRKQYFRILETKRKFDCK